MCLFTLLFFRYSLCQSYDSLVFLVMATGTDGLSVVTPVKSVEISSNLDICCKTDWPRRISTCLFESAHILKIFFLVFESFILICQKNVFLVTMSTPTVPAPRRNVPKYVCLPKVLSVPN